MDSCLLHGRVRTGRPVAQEFLDRYPQSIVVFSFFSPSGYKHAEVDQVCIHKCYLPFDSRRNARRFVSMINPDAAVVVRHDVWPNHLLELSKRGIPSFLIDASISDERLKEARRNAVFMRPVYKLFTEICTVNDEQTARFADLYPGLPRLQACGDTRYDRVLERANIKSAVESIRAVTDFRYDTTLVAGSTWPSDEKIILQAVIDVCRREKQFSCIIAPHEINPQHIDELLHRFSRQNIKARKLSAPDNAPDVIQVLIIDRIGLLANLYAFGQMAYVGGAFGPGIHNVLEPAAHASFVLFGPRHTNSPEPQALIDFGGARMITQGEHMKAELKALITNISQVRQAGRKARKFVQQHAGAQRKTIDRIEENLR
ncbi:MAG: glycosyltransferase N-terminal domain-containing protein [candidate division KSB1 bacterium]|nr:glycosyltransferase N-terminal domain-containing protein [candidate division KSB1 bacterium]